LICSAHPLNVKEPSTIDHSIIEQKNRIKYIEISSGGAYALVEQEEKSGDEGQRQHGPQEESHLSLTHPDLHYSLEIGEVRLRKSNFIFVFF
jgi:hypothetical protein